MSIIPYWYKKKEKSGKKCFSLGWEPLGSTLTTFQYATSCCYPKPPHMYITSLVLVHLTTKSVPFGTFIHFLFLPPLPLVTTNLTFFPLSLIFPFEQGNDVIWLWFPLGFLCLCVCVCGCASDCWVLEIQWKGCLHHWGREVAWAREVVVKRQRSGWI